MKYLLIKRLFCFNNIIMMNSIFSVKFGVVVGVGKKFGAKSTQKLCWINTKYRNWVGVALTTHTKLTLILRFESKHILLPKEINNFHVKQSLLRFICHQSIYSIQTLSASIFIYVFLPCSWQRLHMHFKKNINNIKVILFWVI